MTDQSPGQSDTPDDERQDPAPADTQQSPPTGDIQEPPADPGRSEGGPWWRRKAVIVAAAALVIVAVVVAVVVMITSKSSEEESGPLPDAAPLLKQSSETTKSYNEVHLKLEVAEELQGDLPIESLTGDLTNGPPVQAQGKATVIIFGNRAPDLDFAVFGDDLYASLVKGGSLKNAGPVKDYYDVSLILNPATGLANILANFNDPKTQKLEKIDGVQVAKITGEVSADTVNKIAPQLAVKESESVPATVWIKTDGKHELLRISLEAVPDNSLQMTFSDWGKPVTVNKPAG